MNWDEKAEDYAVAHHTYEHLTPDENAYYTSGFVRGARWMREALLSDDAVERAARALCAAAGENPDSNELWDEEPPWLSYADEARAALTAAIGRER